MKTLIIKDLAKSASEKMELTDIVNVLDKENIDYQPIDIVNWKAFPYQPQVSFRIAWSSETSEIFLQYKVKENGIRGTYGQDKGALPYKDDCVEFFFSPGADSCYYNLELNCIGYGTLACHRPDAETVRYGDEVLSKIRRASSLGNEVIGMKEGEYEWTLVAAIPIEVYGLDAKSLKGAQMTANFYKCGDDTAVPHFLSWNPIPIEKPSFHRPDHFGKIIFE